jgi:hypothetical protein
MMEAVQQARFAFESLGEFRRFVKSFLDRDAVADTELLVDGEIDCAHPALPDLFFDDVTTL